VDGTGSVSFPVASFVFSDDEPSGSPTTAGALINPRDSGSSSDGYFYKKSKQ
jgi:hypothetical protein